jgi:addiction module HigA family antidote
MQHPAIFQIGITFDIIYNDVINIKRSVKMIEENVLKTNYATHPGLTLKEKLDELKITPEELAFISGISFKELFGILNAERPITPEIAVRLEEILDIPASFWLSKQSNYDEYKSR